MLKSTYTNRFLLENDLSSDASIESRLATAVSVEMSFDNDALNVSERRRNTPPVSVLKKSSDS